MKKTLALLLTIAMLVMMLVGCNNTPANTPDNTTDNTPNTSDTNPTTTDPGTTVPSVSGRTDLNIPLASIGNTLDPHDAGLMVDQYVINQIYEPLWYVEDDTSLTPRLALDYTVDETGTEITVNLRDDVTFQNGEKFKASDVVYSYQRCLDNFYHVTDLVGLVSVEALDDTTVKFTLDGPNSIFLSSMNNIWIVSEKAVEEAGDRFGAIPTLAGTGPYILDYYDQNTKIVLKANPDYWRGEATIKTINFTPMADSSTQLLAFQNGEFDFCNIPSADWNTIVSSGNYTTVQAPSKHVSYIGLNVGKPDNPLYDVRVRQAIHYCIDKESMCLVAADGFADVATHYVRSGYFEGAQEVGIDFSYNPEKAKELLAEAGYADGCDVGTISVINGGGGRYIKIAQLLQQNMQDVGITCQIEIGETGAILTDIAENHTYDMFISGMTFNSSFADSYSSFGLFDNAEVQLKSNENIDAQWVDDMFIKARAEMDTEKRNAIYAEVEEYVHDLCCYLPVIHIQNLYAWDKNLNAAAPLNLYEVYNWSWN